MPPVFAPELAPALAFVNTTRPLSLRELRGRVVVLHFWTSSSVNGAHVQAMLRELEDRFEHEPVVVVDVHTAKFDGESSPERVAEAVRRLGVRHPVVVDDDMQIWERYGVRAWPTLVVVRPDGTIAATVPDEPDVDVLAAFVAQELALARRHEHLAEVHQSFADAPFELCAPRTSALAYPSKVAVAPDGRVAVADAGNHRVLVLAGDGRVVEVVGAGVRGYADGPLEEALLDTPQGVAWDDGLLWICDARNHVLLRADFFTRTLTTVAGTGRMGRGPLGREAPGREVALRSPSDVVVDDTRIYVALTGSHQLGVYDKQAQTMRQLAGTGREALIDGHVKGASFAQPCSLSLCEGTLYVADSATSAVRAVRLDSGEVDTLVGVGPFEFGYEDGLLPAARLQHPLAVLALDGRVFVADALNDAVRVFSPSARELSTHYRGSGADALSLPSALAPTPTGGLLVADTNHHRLLRLDAQGARDGELVPHGAPELRRGAPRRRQAAVAAGASAERGRWLEVRADTVTLAPGAQSWSFEVAPPAGWHLDATAPVRLALEVSEGGELLTPSAKAVLLDTDAAHATTHLPAHLGALDAERREGELLVVVDAVLCQDGAATLCAPSRGWYRIGLVLCASGRHELAASLPLSAPAVARPTA